MNRKLSSRKYRTFPEATKTTMTIRIAQFVHAASDVVDEAFLRDFPEVEAAKAHNLESLAKALDGANLNV